MNRLADNVIAYDFVHPGHKLQTRWPVLDGVHRELVAGLARSLGQRLQLDVSADVEAPVLGKYSDYVAGLGRSALEHEFALPPLSGHALFGTDSAVISALVDAWFGGDGAVVMSADSCPEALANGEDMTATEDAGTRADTEPADTDDADEGSVDELSEPVSEQGAEESGMPPGLDQYEPPRTLSSTEQRLQKHLLGALAEALVTGWQPLRILQPEHTQLLSLPQVRRARDQVVVVCRFTLKFKQGLAPCVIVYPHAMLEPLDTELSRDPEKPARQDTTFGLAMHRQLLHCELDVNAVLAELKITLGQVLAMKPGDFIPLRDIETVSFTTQKTPLFDARLGVSNGRVSASLQRWRLPEQA